MPVLPKSTNPRRLRQKADVFPFNIDDGDMAALEKLDRGDGVTWPGVIPSKLRSNICGLATPSVEVRGFPSSPRPSSQCFGTIGGSSSSG